MTYEKRLKEAAENYEMDTYGHFKSPQSTEPERGIVYKCFLAGAAYHAERIKELEDEVQVLRLYARDLEKSDERIRDYEEALEAIAEYDTKYAGPSRVSLHKARAALEKWNPK